MKKSLLSFIAMCLFAITAMAQSTDVKWTAATEWTTDSAKNITYVQTPYTIAIVKNNGSTSPSVNGATLDARAYAKGTVTVSTTGDNMKGIVFYLSAQGKKRLAEITASTGNVAIDTEAATVTWTGDANSVDFTVGDKAVYGTDGETKAGQFCFNYLTVSTDGEVVTPDPGTDPDPEEPASNVIFEETFLGASPSFTIEDVTSPVEGKTVWVYSTTYGAKASGYISKVNYDCEGWLISPVIDLTAANNVMLTFEEAANFFNDQATFKANTYLAVREEGGEWAKVDYASDATGMSYTYCPAEVDLTSYKGKKIQLGFHYVGTTEVCGTWEFKNLVVKDAAPTAIATVETAQPATTTIYAIDGRRLTKPMKGINIINGKKVIF